MRAIRILAALSILAASAGRSSAGEEGEGKAEEQSFYTRVSWQEAQEAAAGSCLVAVGRVIEAGTPKGGGWNGGIERGTPQNGNRNTCQIDVQQEAVVEVTEVLRGELASKKLTVRLGKIKLDYMAVSQFWSGLVQAKKLNVRSRKLPVSFFALVAGRECVFFIKSVEAVAGGDGDGKLPVGVHLDGAVPAESPDAMLMRSVRAFCGELSLWDKPPDLPEEQNKVILDMIAGLGAEDFEAREKAEDALRAVGARARPFLEQAVKDADEERSYRARQLLKAVKPEPGKTELPGGAGGGKAPEIFLKRPEPKPAPEPAPDEAGGGDDPGAGE